MAYDGSLKFDTAVDQKGFTSGITQLKNTAMAAIGAIGAAFATGAIAKALLDVGKQGIELASNLEEVQNVIDVTFGDGAERINDFAKSAVTSFGLSELAAKKYTGTMGAMLKSMGLASSEVENMSTSMTGLAGDFASFYNITQEDAFQKIRAGIAGEIEPLRQLGVNMSIANLEAYALAQGIDKSYASMTQAEQATLRYNYLMSITADAQGDFARTSDSYANSQRLAALATDELKTALGNRLLPIATKMQGVIRDLALEAATAVNERGIVGVIDIITDRFPVATAAVTGLAAAFAALLIIQAVQKGMAAFTATEALLTLATKFGTLAQWQELGALSAKHIIVAALTGKVGLATAAQWLFNAAIAANPVMLLVVAIGALVGGLVLLNKRYEKLHPEIQQTKEEIDALAKSVEDSSKAYSDNLDEIDSQQRGAESLISTLEELSASYTGSRIEQSKMQAIVDQLNGAYEGLNLSFDTNTGKLSQNADAVRDLVSAQIDAARKTATLNRYTQLLADQQDAEYEMRKAQKAFYAAGDQGLVTQRKTNEAYRKSIDVLDQVTAELEDCNVQLVEQNEAVQDLDPSLNILGYRLGEVSDATDRVIIGGYDFTDSLAAIGMTADQVSERLNNFTGAATNMFEKIDTKARIRVKTMIENLTANTAAIEQWGDNIALLGDQLPDDLLQPLIDQGPEKMAGVLNALAKASPEELDALVTQFNAGGEAAREAWLQSLGAGTSAEEDPLATVLEGSTDAAKKAGEEAGAALVQSISEQDYTEATGTMTDAFTEAFRQIKEAFAEMLQRIHYDLAYAIGGVSIDIAQMARDVNRALSSIKTSITIRVNTIYTSEGSPSGGAQRYDILGHPLAKGMDYIPYDGYPAILHKGEGVLTASEASLWRKIKDVNGASAATVNTARVASVGASAGKTVNVSAPITVQGVTESPAKLAAKLTKNLEGVLYGNT